MAVLNALLGLLALVALAMFPCLVVLVVFADNLFSAIARTARRTRFRSPVEPTGPPLEQIAADLHRLGHSRHETVPGSVRHTAVTRAYDRRLAHACRALDLDEYLTELSDMDLELERLRVESLLVGVGFVLVGIDSELDVDGRQDHC